MKRIVLCAFLLSCLISNRAGALTFEERVEAQRAIERVYYNHRIWPKENPGLKPTFEQAVPDDAIRSRVEEYLKKNALLQDRWHYAISEKDLQAELDRIVHNTKDPETLKALFRSLNNDPQLIAECLVRPLLANRIIRKLYAYDADIHTSLRSKIDEIQAALARDPNSSLPQGEMHSVRIHEDDGVDTAPGSSETVSLPPDAFHVEARKFPLEKGQWRMEETLDAFVFRKTVWRSDTELQGEIRLFAKTPFEVWFRKATVPASTFQEVPSISLSMPAPKSLTYPSGPDSWALSPAVPAARSSHIAVWTGSEMIIWGGGFQSGSRYNPVLDSWTPVTQIGAPSARSFATGVWTGSEMIIWGGVSTVFENTGGRYNPTTDTWVATEFAHAPAQRERHTAVWTGTKMIVWGGFICPSPVPACLASDGSAYEPDLDNGVNNPWSAIASSSLAARWLHTAVWSGTEMLIWGGSTDFATTFTNTGARYNPSLNTWQNIQTTGAPSGRGLHTAVWTGEEMIVWGGFSGTALGDGRRYNPSFDTWSSDLPATNEPVARTNHTAVWTGSEMIVFGGATCTPGCVATNTGGRYSPALNSWNLMATGSDARSGHTAVWTGDEMITWGGAGASGELLDSGGRYSPILNTWTPTAQSTGPTARIFHTAIWTGSEMVVWGGRSAGALRSGGIYTPALDSWVDTAASGAPSARYSHTAVWTGSEMIVWGGTTGASNNFNDGARFDPVNNVWIGAVDTTGAPTARYDQTAVWTGTQMIVWGGSDGSARQNTGGLYTPGGSWAAGGTSTSNAPAGRVLHTAIWTGSKMVVWGGCSLEFPCNNASLFNDGGLYDPLSNTWTPGGTSTTNAPQKRWQHTSVWTGTRMIVWGGTTLGGTDDSGGIFDPVANSWMAGGISASGTPRIQHTAVWTGTEMIVWGGQSCAPTCVVTNTGGRYNPLNDSWSSMAIGPPGRGSHTAVWTGQEMSVWGGAPESSLAIFYPNTSPLAVIAIYDSTLKAPRCSNIGGECDSGGMVNGRDGIAGGAEPNQPNTILNSCADGTSGVYHSDESLDRIRISTADGSTFAAGTVARVDVTVWAFAGGFSSDALDLYYAADATNPSWTFLTTIVPTGPGQQVLSAFYTLPSGNLQAVRAQFRYLGSEGPCSTGGFDDHDDLIFTVNPSTPYPTFTLGVGDTLQLDGSGSADGSNPYTTTPNHDKLDSVTAYEWDLNDDAGWADNCSGALAGVDVVGASQALGQSSLPQGFVTPGNHLIWLRVTDEVGIKNCVSATVTVLDGQPPSAAVVAPDGGESWAYSADVVNRQHHLVVWTAVDNFPPLGRTRLSYSTDGVNYTCIADSSGASCGVNGLAAGDTNYLWSMPTQAEAAAAGQTFPTATARLKVDVWDGSNNTAADISDANFYIIQPTTSAIKTLIFWNSARIGAQYGTTQRNALSSKLIELSDHNKINGFILDLNTVPAINSAYATWDADPANQTKANAVAAAIRNYIVDQVTNTFTAAQFLILAGDDTQIPHFRMVDGTTFYTEDSYPAQVGLNTATTVGAAINQGYFLTDNYYSELQPEPTGLNPPHDLSYLNDLYIGRLIETPTQMEDLINVYLEQDGQVNVTTSSDRILVAGHDFLYDSAKSIRDGYANPPASKATDALLDDPDVSGDEYDPLALQTQLLSVPPHRIMNLNDHANHFSFSTSTGSLNTTTLDASATEMRGSVLYSPGCHSGLNVPASDSHALDLPELMSKKKVVGYIGNTGYGWGLRYGTGLSEKMMELISEEILENGSIAIGKAMGDAKRRYHITESRYDVFDEKVEHELTLYGIPNYLIVTNNGSAPQHAKAELPKPDGPNSGCANGICVKKSLTSLPIGVTELNLNFDFSSAYQTHATPDGTYYTLNGQSSGETGEPIQPHFSYDSALSGTKAHGVIFIGGAYQVFTPFDPVIAVPRSTNTDSGEGPIPARITITPDIRTSLDQSGQPTSTPPLTNMVVHTGIYNNNTEKRFNTMQFAVYYSDEVSNQDVDAPVIADPGPGGFHTLSGNTASFAVQVSDASGVYRVLVAYEDTATGMWKLLDLVYNAATGNWEGSLSVTTDTVYFVQAVDANGNVGILADSGADLDGDGQPYGSTWSGSRVYVINAGQGYLFFDDFEDNDVSDWTPLKGTWTASGGAMHGTFNKKADSFPNGFPLPGCSGCTIEADLQVDTPNARVSLLGWYTGKKDYVEIRLMDDKDKVLLKQFTSAGTAAKQSMPFAINPGTNYHVKVSYGSGAFSVTIDGAPLMTVNTLVTPSGTVGFRVKSTTGAPATGSFGEVIVY